MHIIRNFKKYAAFLLIIALAFTGSGCGTKTKVSDKAPEVAVNSGNLNIYYLNIDGTGLEKRPYTPEHTEPLEVAEELIRKMYSDPPELTLQKCILNKDMINSVKLDDNEITIDFSSTYYKNVAITEVLRRAGIVKTLCQVKEIQYVVFTVEGQSLVIDGSDPVGRMNGDDFIDNTGGETTYYQDVQVTLYYADASGKKLRQSRHNIVFDGTISLEELVMIQLLSGPLPEEKLANVIPEGTYLNNVSLKDGICRVNLSSEFLNGVEGVSPEIIIYSIVNSLVELKGVSKVQILVDGKTIDRYREKIKLSSPLERNLDLVAAD